MDVKIYFRDVNQQLVVFLTTNIYSVEQGRQLVLEQLHQTKERFVGPMLGLIQGGKA